MVGMIQASRSAALNADEVRVGMVVAAEMIVKAGILIAIADSRSERDGLIKAGFAAEPSYRY
jgi:hypothetical protein